MISFFLIRVEMSKKVGHRPTAIALLAQNWPTDQPELENRYFQLGKKLFCRNFFFYLYKYFFYFLIFLDRKRIMVTRWSSKNTFTTLFIIGNSEPTHSKIDGQLSVSIASLLSQVGSLCPHKPPWMSLELKTFQEFREILWTKKFSFAF